MLELLERSNLFVVPLDDQRQWFRYHHLFADALRAQLTSTDPDRLADLHRAAARWYAEHGRLADAVPHALAGGDTEGAADLVELALPELRMHRHDRTLRDWLRELPDDVRSDAVRCSRRSWRGSGCPRATSTASRPGSTWRRPASARRPRAGRVGGAGSERLSYGADARRTAGGCCARPREGAAHAAGHDRGLPRVARPGARRR